MELMMLRRRLLAGEAENVDYFDGAVWIANKVIVSSGAIANNGLGKYNDPAIVIPPGKYRIIGTHGSSTASSFNVRLHGYSDADSWLMQIAYWAVALNADFDVNVDIPATVHAVRLSAPATTQIQMYKA